MRDMETILLYAGSALCAVSIAALLVSLLLLRGRKKLIEKQLELEYGKRPEVK